MISKGTNQCRSKRRSKELFFSDPEVALDGAEQLREAAPTIDTEEDQYPGAEEPRLRELVREFSLVFSEQSREQHTQLQGLVSKLDTVCTGHCLTLQKTLEQLTTVIREVQISKQDTNNVYPASQWGSCGRIQKG